MRSTNLLLAVCLLTPAPLAQSGTSGSETSVSPARNLSSAGGRTASESAVAEVELAFATGGEATTSESYRFLGGTVWSGNGFAPTGPVVFGIAQPAGTKDGGLTELVHGLGFQTPGAGVTTASLGGQAAGGVTVLSNSQLSLVTPPGVNPFGNPLGRVGLAVANDHGASALEGGYVYTPALDVAEPPRAGEDFSIHLFAKPGDFQDLYLGLSLPGVALPVAGIEGAWELLGFFASPLSATFASADVTTWTLPVPASPSLVGKTIEWQAYSFGSLAPLSGSFTNRLSTTISG